jgi:hypothetical protein
LKNQRDMQQFHPHPPPASSQWPMGLTREPRPELRGSSYPRVVGEPHLVFWAAFSEQSANIDVRILGVGAPHRVLLAGKPPGHVRCAWYERVCGSSPDTSGSHRAGTKVRKSEQFLGVFRADVHQCTRPWLGTSTAGDRRAILSRPMIQTPSISGVRAVDPLASLPGSILQHRIETELHPRAGYRRMSQQTESLR